MEAFWQSAVGAGTRHVSVLPTTPRVNATLLSITVSRWPENPLRLLLVGSFRSMVPEGHDGPFGGQGGFVDTLAPAPYSLANAYLEAFVEADPTLRDRIDVRLLDLAEPLAPEDEREDVVLREPDLDRIVAQGPSMLGLSAYCWNIDAILAAAPVLRARLPHVPMVLGGRATDADPRAILAQNPAVDAVVVGEGELPMRDILRAGTFEGIPGVFARRGSDVLCGGPPRSVARLDDIPSPWLAGILSPVKNAMMMELSRGCRHACGYCSWNSDKKLRFFGESRIEQELRWAVEHGHEHVTLNDSAINYDADRLEAFVDAVHAADPDGRLHFTYNIRHDELDGRQIRALSRIRTHMVLLGIETLSARAMGQVDRAPVHAADLRKRLIGLSRAVRPPVASIVLGLPEDDEKGFLETLDTLLGWTEPDADGVRPVGTVLVSLLQVYGGSKLWQRREELGLSFQPMGIPYLLEGPGWPPEALARCKAQLVQRIADDPERLKAAEALALIRDRGGVSPWLSRRVLRIVLHDWPVGQSHDGWTLVRVGWMRDTGQGALLRFEHESLGEARVRLTLDRGQAPGRYRVETVPSTQARLHQLVQAVVRRGEHRAAAFVAGAKRR